MTEMIEMDNSEMIKSCLEDGTSPSILQDITMNKTEMDARGAPGLTMKEYDDNIKKLTAENFQLKLKLYFLNERLTKMDGINDKDVLRENVDLKVENKEKAEEIERQSKLLTQALEAIEQMQSEHQQELNKLTAKYEDDISDAQIRSGALETRIQLLKDTENDKIASVAEENVVCRKCEQVEAELAARVAELAALQAAHDRAVDTVKSFVRRVLDERNEIKRLETELNTAKCTIDGLELRLRRAEEININHSFSENVEETLDRIKELENEVTDLKKKPPTSQLMEKECEIEQMKRDLQKRTLFLQELVNKELWDKNKRIEKLEKKIVSSDSDQLKAEIQKLLDEKRALNEQLSQMKDKQVNFKEACFMLTKRLEELTGFLDSLITDRSLIQFNGDAYNAIKRAIDSSRELSRRLTISFNEYESERRESEPLTLTADDSERHWIDLEMPAESDNEEEERTAKPSAPSPATGIRKRVEKFCVRALGGNKGEMEASESEAWSEPDRSVSLARMGHIDSASLTPLRLSKCKNSSGSSEETLNETGNRTGKRTRCVDSEVKKLQMRVKSLEETNKDLKAQLILLENKHVILGKLNGHSSPQLFLEIQESLNELDETREQCQRLKHDLAAARGDLTIARQDLDDKERQCNEQMAAIAKLETKSDEIVLEYEMRLIELTKERDMAEQRASDFEKTLAMAEEMRIALEKRVIEINDKLTESQSWQNKSKAQVREAEKHLDSCEKIIQDKCESEKKMKELQQFVECLQKNLDEKQTEIDLWTARAQREHDDVTELKRRLLETERSKMVVESKVKEEGERIKWMEGKLRELEQAMDECEQATQTRISDEVRRRIDCQIVEIKKEWVPRVELERARQNLDDLEQRLAHNDHIFKEREDNLLKKLNKIEKEKRDWWRQMNDLRLASSKMEVELTRLANEKIGLEEQLRIAVEQHAEAVKNHERAELSLRVLQKQAENENCAAASLTFHDYLSTRNMNSSPDLGIESDQGRFSSLEHHEQPSRYNRLEAENEDLKQQIVKLSQNLEETEAELAIANHEKKQIERAICKQLHQTHHMLKKTRRNFEQPDSDSF